MGYKLRLSVVLVAIVGYFVRKQYFPSIVLSPIVELEGGGKVQGRISTSRDGREYYEYLGLPYATPPIGELRYEPPEPFTQQWDGVRDATQLGAACLQVNTFFNSIEGDEDCLFVNVHTPQLAGSSSKLPVLFWIHGGYFAFGSGNIYRPDYFMDEDVVLITVNYRLSTFGFLNTGDGLVKGNMALKDQNMALKWVRDNVEKFGGNKNDVTIFGESAGAVCSHYQMLSPMSKGLYHKVFAQSGLATMPWAYRKNPIPLTERFASQVNCPTSPTAAMVSCLKKKDAVELASAYMEIADQLKPLSFIFIPTIEIEMGDGKTFLAQEPKKIIESGNFARVPFLTGVNDREGLMLAAPAVANATFTSALISSWDRTISRILVLPEDTKPEILTKIKDFYIKNGAISLENPMTHYLNISNIATDWLWKLGFQHGMMLHQKWTQPTKSPLFIYYYTYEGEYSLDQMLMYLKGEFHPVVEVLLGKLKTWWKTQVMGESITRYGSCHGDELAMQFHIPDIQATNPKDSKDYKFSKQLIKTIMQFVRLDLNKKSTPSLDFMGQKWIPQEPNKPLEYFQIGQDSKMIPEPFGKKEREFWNQFNLL